MLPRPRAARTDRGHSLVIGCSKAEPVIGQVGEAGGDLRLRHRQAGFVRPVELRTNKPCLIVGAKSTKIKSIECGNDQSGIASLSPTQCVNRFHNTTTFSNFLMEHFQPQWMEVPVGCPRGEQKVFVRLLCTKNQQDVEWNHYDDQLEFQLKLEPMDSFFNIPPECSWPNFVVGGGQRESLP